MNKKIKDSKLMYVWNDNESPHKRIVIDMLKTGQYMAIADGDEEMFLNGNPNYCYTIWNHCSSLSELKLTAVVKSAEEITGIKGIVDILLKNKNGVKYSYNSSMGELVGQRIELIKNFHNYDYYGKNYGWLKSWLKSWSVNMEEEINSVSYIMRCDNCNEEIQYIVRNSTTNENLSYRDIRHIVSIKEPIQYKYCHNCNLETRQTIIAWKGTLKE